MKFIPSIVATFLIVGCCNAVMEDSRQLFETLETQSNVEEESQRLVMEKSSFEHVIELIEEPAFVDNGPRHFVEDIIPSADESTFRHLAEMEQEDEDAIMSDLNADQGMDHGNEEEIRQIQRANLRRV